MAKDGSIIDYAVVSNSLTSMVDCIYADEDDPFQPHRSVIMKFHGDVNSISECNASTPTQYPEARPIGPHRKIKNHALCEDDDLEEHASKVMNMIEAELAAKFHVDHVVDANGFCTYMNRSDGLFLRNARRM